MIRLSQNGLLTLLAILAMGVGCLLPFNSTVQAGSISLPAEEEKNPAEPTDEIKLSQTSSLPTFSRNPPRSIANSKIGFARSVTSNLVTPTHSPADALNNGLATYYRC